VGDDGSQIVKKGLPFEGRMGTVADGDEFRALPEQSTSKQETTDYSIILSARATRSTGIP
jgi:hypothetical protein